MPFNDINDAAGQGSNINNKNAANIICQTCTRQINTGVQSFFTCDTCDKCYHPHCKGILGQHIKRIASSGPFYCSTSCNPTNSPVLVNLTSGSGQQVDNEVIKEILDLSSQVKLLNLNFGEIITMLVELKSNQASLLEKVDELTLLLPPVPLNVVSQIPHQSGDSEQTIDDGPSVILPTSLEPVVGKSLVCPTSANSDNRPSRPNKKINQRPLANVSSQQQPVIIGTGDLDTSLQVIEPRRSLFLSRLHKNIADVHVKTYIKGKFNVEDVNCQRIIPRRINEADRNYSSFKISVPASVLDGLLQPESWPSGTLVKEFINHRRKASNVFFPTLQQNKPAS